MQSTRKLADWVSRIGVLTLKKGQDHPLSGCSGYDKPQNDKRTGAYVPDTDYLYVGTNTNPGRVIKIDLLSNTIERSCTLLPGEVSILWAGYILCRLIFVDKTGVCGRTTRRFYIYLRVNLHCPSEGHSHS